MRRGITLIELLVAMVISGIVAFMVLAMFRGESKNYTQMRSRVRLQGDAREAVRIIEEELNNAGYRMGASVAGGILSSTECIDGGYTGFNGAFFKPITNGIEYTVYDPYQSAGILNCTDDLQRIRYTWDPTDSILFRRWVKGKDTDIDAAEDVPFMEHVASFVVEYGVYRDNTILMDETQSGAATLSASGITVAPVNSGTTWTFTSTGWTTGAGSFILNPGAGFTLDTNATYRVKFQSFANDAFLDGTTGIDPATLKAGFFLTGGVATKNVFTFRPGTSSGAGGARTVQFDLNPSSDGIANPMYFGITGKLGAASAGAPSMGISGIQITKLNHGKIETWVTDPASTQDWSKIGAARITLSVRGKNGEIITHSRTVVLINNDPRI